MEKRKRWQFILITVVILLTIYNILPTVLFYSKPLKEPIGEKKAYEVAEQAASRVNQLEPEAISWLKSYNKLLKTKTKSIQIDPQNPELVHLTGAALGLFGPGERGDPHTVFECQLAEPGPGCEGRANGGGVAAIDFDSGGRDPGLMGLPVHELIPYDLRG